MNILICNSQSTGQCGLCFCVYTEPVYIVDCENAGIHEFPELDYSVAKLVVKAFMRKNHLTVLNSSIFKSWEILKLIDLSDNNLTCTEITKIPETVKVITDCKDEKGKHFIIIHEQLLTFLFLLLLSLLLQFLNIKLK